ncbi:EF-P beta-lysylation protein EpmB [Solemya velum gill symbiont]|uniref:EF-P beta-lysylation protein EpmB n=1 Tax=Solemya velum gill symbiont TaxID=2340 RepID=UPI000995F436|nr:EF-P beta-lysylation protein EpmB [Solemya velum gill symbiont]OOZ03253.1 EF-P beta-lysylation protein EpmB [Solemya velum gill symbiont]
MITRNLRIENDKMSWEQQYAASFRNPTDLLTWLSIDIGTISDAIDTDSEFPLRVPHAFASRMLHGNPDDPLLRQVLPLKNERIPVSGFSNDPLDEENYNVGNGIIKKYQGRALLIATGACAIHCRYCFRRHYPYADESLTREQISTMISELRRMGDLDEVILSGGDPLSLSDSRLEELLDALATLPKLRRLRLHTRLPIVLPDRVTGRLATMLGQFPTEVVCVMHANHPNELDDQVAAAMHRLRVENVTLLNQSVLLNRINNDSDTIELLCKKGFEMGVLSYYLHQLDPVSGTHAFAVGDAEANEIHAELLTRLPGYLVPKLVREQAGALSKTPL